MNVWVVDVRLYLEPELDVVAAAHQRHVVVELEARVVILDRNEEGKSETVLASEVDARVRKWPALARKRGAVVGAGPVLARELESRFVQRDAE